MVCRKLRICLFQRSQLPSNCLESTVEPLLYFLILLADDISFRVHEVYEHLLVKPKASCFGGVGIRIWRERMLGRMALVRMSTSAVEYAFAQYRERVEEGDSHWRLFRIEGFRIIPIDGPDRRDADAHLN